MFLYIIRIVRTLKLFTSYLIAQCRSNTNTCRKNGQFEWNISKNPLRSFRWAHLSKNVDYNTIDCRHMYSSLFEKCWFHKKCLCPLKYHHSLPKFKYKFSPKDVLNFLANKGMKFSFGNIILILPRIISNILGPSEIT